MGAPVLAVDLDGDGQSELVTEFGWIGRRQSPGRYAFSASYDAVGASLGGPQALGDLNGDGAVDLVGLVLTAEDVAQIWVAWGDGRGNLTFDVIDLDSILSGQPCGYVVDVADLDEDGIAEVLVTDPPGFEVAIVDVEPGAAEEIGRLDLSMGTTWDPLACEGVLLRVGDLDGDQHDDVSVHRGLPPSMVAFGAGDGSLARPIPWEGPSTPSALDWGVFSFSPVSLRRVGVPGIAWAQTGTLMFEAERMVLHARLAPDGEGDLGGFAIGVERFPSMPQVGKLGPDVVIAVATLGEDGVLLLGCVGELDLDLCAKIPIGAWDSGARPVARGPSVLVVGDSEAPGLIVPRRDPPGLGWIPLLDEPAP